MAVRTVFNVYSKIFNNISRNFSDKPGDQKVTKKTPHLAFRHNYPDELEGAVNNQILMEFNASMAYLSISVYYGRTQIALPGCQLFFKKMYLEEQQHAMTFIDYQLLRGGHVKLYPLTVPEDQEWTDITVSLGVALDLEKGVKQKLECLFSIAEKYEDMHLMDVLSTKFVPEQDESICEMGRLLTRAKRLVDTGGVGRHLFDKEIFNYVSQKIPEEYPRKTYI